MIEAEFCFTLTEFCVKRKKIVLILLFIMNRLTSILNYNQFIKLIKQYQYIKKLKLEIQKLIQKYSTYVTLEVYFSVKIYSFLHTIFITLFFTKFSNLSTLFKLFWQLY